VQAGGIAALRDCEPEVKNQVKIYQQRRDLLYRGLKEIGWEVDKPKAGMFLWTRIPETKNHSGSMDFVLQMIERVNVVAAPGIGFGDEGEGYLRLALVENESRLCEALERLKNL
jgi:alanine-synthesizing transaminase